MTTVAADTPPAITALRDAGWEWTRIGAHYGVSEKAVRNWHRDGTIPERAPAPPAAIDYATAFIVSDVQWPYADRNLLDTVGQIIADLKPDRLIWDGDNIDFPQLSRFAHDPYALDSAAADVDAFHTNVRDLLRHSWQPPAEDWSNGNHEHRYQKYIGDQAAALGGLPTIQEFMKLPPEIQFAPYGRGIGIWLTPRLLVSHGWRAAAHSAYTAKLSLDDLGGGASVITGHTHRIGMHARTTPEGVVRSYEIGHMADMATIPKAVSGLNNWQQVAGTIVRYPRAGSLAADFTVDILPVMNDRRVIANGRTYKIGA